MTVDELARNAEAYAKTLAGRDYRRAGIEMFLALDTLQSARPLPPISDGSKLADAAERVAAELLKTRRGDPVRALRVALELVATADFGADLGPPSQSGHLDPAATGAGRKPLRLAAGTSGAAKLLADIRAGGFVRAVNWHNTLTEDSGKLERQLSHLAERFVSVGVPELTRLINGEPWPHHKPPVMLVFYEGLRNQVDAALPLLSTLGLTGIFCLIPGFIDEDVSSQIAFARRNYIDVRPSEYPDGRVALSWDEARELGARGHSFVCHTMTHADPDAAHFDAFAESVGAVGRMADELGATPDVFVWRRGLEVGDDPAADRLVYQAGPHLLLSNFRIQHLPDDLK